MAVHTIKVVEAPLIGTNDGRQTWRVKLKSDGANVAVLFLFGDKTHPTHVGEIPRSELLEMLDAVDRSNAEQANA